MRRLLGLLVAAAFLASCGLADVPARGQEKKGGVEVVIDGLKSTTPAEWKEEQPKSTMRYKQFRLPKVKGDKDDAELLMFKLGGSSQANLKRWMDQFIPPEGKKLDDVAKITEMKIGGLDAYYLDIHGTYKFKDLANPKSKEERRPNQRMLAVQIEGKTSPYQIRLTGPAATVEHYKKGFDEWLKAFK